MQPTRADVPQRISTRLQDDDFFIYHYKIHPCPVQQPHDIQGCPYAHPGEASARRDPAVHKYASVTCPNAKLGTECPRGRTCKFAHHMFEYWLHPSRYRTQLCRDGTACKRTICFFAHHPGELRHPPKKERPGAGGGGGQQVLPGGGLGEPPGGMALDPNQQLMLGVSAAPGGLAPMYPGQQAMALQGGYMLVQSAAGGGMAPGVGVPPGVPVLPGQQVMLSPQQPQQQMMMMVSGVQGGFGQAGPPPQQLALAGMQGLAPGAGHYWLPMQQQQALGQQAPQLQQEQLVVWQVPGQQGLPPQQQLPGGPVVMGANQQQVGGPPGVGYTLVPSSTGLYAPLGPAAPQQAAPVLQGGMQMQPGGVPASLPLAPVGMAMGPGGLMQWQPGGDALGGGSLAPGAGHSMPPGLL